MAPVFVPDLGSCRKDDFVDDDRSFKIHVNESPFDKVIYSGNVNRVFVVIEQIGERVAWVVEAVRMNFPEIIITRPNLKWSYNNILIYGFKAIRMSRTAKTCVTRAIMHRQLCANCFVYFEIVENKWSSGS